ncbi:MAG: RNA-binding S4 domain-containing protein [Bacteroidales bacterium]
MSNIVRVDKWLWAVRIFKTRSLATEQIKKGRVMLNGASIKPSRTLHAGDTVQVKKPPITYSFKVLDVADKRMGAKEVSKFCENITAPEELEILDIQKGVSIYRDRGTGRPTKKERRDIEKFFFDESLEDEDN